MKIRDRIVGLRRVPARSLRPHPKNWRLHPRTQKSALRGILEEVGYASALLAREAEDGSLELIDGHLRAETTPDQEVPVLVLDVTKEEAEKLLASMDPIGALAGKDEEILRNLLQGIEAETEGLKTLFEGLVPAERKGGRSDPDALPEPPAEARTRPGDLYLLGEHRLLCGDSGSETDVDRLLAGAPIHLVNMDPPYNVRVEPRSNNAIAAAARERTHHQSLDFARHPEKAQPTGPMRPKDRPLENDFLPEEEFARLLLRWFGNAARVLVPGRSFYIWGGYANLANYPQALKASGLYFSQAVIWVKEHPVMTRKDFMGNHEWCMHGWKEGAAHYFHPTIHNATDVWTVKKVSPQKMVHLTEKPVELALRAMEYSSRKGENVLDLFGGSGSTLIAAEQAGRKAFLMELDALYCDVIVARWEEFTGRKAERESR